MKYLFFKTLEEAKKEADRLRLELGLSPMDVWVEEYWCDVVDDVVYNLIKIRVDDILYDLIRKSILE